VTAFFSLPLVNPPIESSRALLLLSDLGSEGAAGGLPAAGGGGGPGGGGGGGAGAAGVLGVEVGLEAGRDAGLEFLSFTVEFLAVLIHTHRMLNHRPLNHLSPQTSSARFFSSVFLHQSYDEPELCSSFGFD